MEQQDFCFCCPYMDIVWVLLFVEVETQFACPSTHYLVHTSKMELTHLELESRSTDHIQGAGCWCLEVFKVPLGIHSRPSFSLYPLVGYMCWSPWILLFGLFFFWVCKPYNNTWRNTCESLTPDPCQLTNCPGVLDLLMIEFCVWRATTTPIIYTYATYQYVLDPGYKLMMILCEAQLAIPTYALYYHISFFILQTIHSSVACLWWHHCFLLF